MNNLVLTFLPKKAWVVLVGAIKSAIRQANSEETSLADQLPQRHFLNMRYDVIERNHESSIP